MFVGGKEMKNFMKLFFTGLICMSLVACNKKEEIVIDGDNKIANPWSEVNNISEAKTITGFDFIVPEEINGNKQSLIQVMEDSLIEVRFGDDIILRKSKGSDDNSGDFNSYDVTKEETISYIMPDATYGTADSLTLTLKGNGDTYNCIIWTIGDYAYSITSSNGLSLDVITETINSII